MLKKLMLSLAILFMINSCAGLAAFALYKGVATAVEETHERNIPYKKDGAFAITNKKYKNDILAVVKDVSERPLVQTKIDDDKQSFFLPKGTKTKNFFVGSRTGLDGWVFNLVDEKTGYGIPIVLKKNSLCYTKEFNQISVPTYLSIENPKYELNQVLTLEEQERLNIDKLVQKIREANPVDERCKE